MIAWLAFLTLVGILIAFGVSASVSLYTKGAIRMRYFRLPRLQRRRVVITPRTLATQEAIASEFYVEQMVDTTPLDRSVRRTFILISGIMCVVVAFIIFAIAAIVR